MAEAGTRRLSYYDNFLLKYPAVKSYSKTMDAAKFGEIWQHYDSNNSGYIDDEGLDKFFRDFLMTTSNASITPQLVQDLKECFMESYDDAKDGRIAITELANILPTDENFILLFRRSENLQSTVDLLQMWTKFDKNKSGFINKGELGDFIRDLLAQKGKTVPPAKIKEYEDGILKIFDKNDDGRLSLAEMSRLLAIKPEENFLTKCTRVSKFDDMGERDRLKNLNAIFDHYDKGKTGKLEGAEIDMFVRDLHDYAGVSKNVDSGHPEDSMKHVEIYKRDLMSHCDLDKDDKLSKKEVLMILGFHA